MSSELPLNSVELPPPVVPLGLREKLLTATRREFRGDEIVFEVDDPVFGSPPCRVPSCPRGSHSRGLCNGHHARWNYSGRPDLEQFTADATLLGHRDTVAECEAADCRFAASTRGLCHSHHGIWKRLGRPELPAALATLGPVATHRPPTDCMVEDCERWAQSLGPLCRSHAQQWRHQGSPPIEEFADGHGQPPLLPPCERIVLAGLAPQMRREMPVGGWCLTGRSPACPVSKARHRALGAVTFEGAPAHPRLPIPGAAEDRETVPGAPHGG